MFSYPQENSRNRVEIFWKRWSKEKIVTNDRDKNQFIFHQNKSYIIEKYRERTKLIGKVKEGNCSLNIQNVTENEPKIYLRVNAAKDNYSFIQDYVSILVSGEDFIVLHIKV